MVLGRLRAVWSSLDESRYVASSGRHTVWSSLDESRYVASSGRHTVWSSLDDPGMLQAQAGIQFNPTMPGMMHSSMMPGMNPQAQYQQQQYAQYQQFQQQQMQARVQMQQAWLQHQQSIQQDWMQRQQVIGSLTQEIHKIRQQIQLVASGGVGSSVLGVTTAGLNTGANLGIQLASTGAPVHSPAPSTHTNTNPGGDLPVIESR